MVVVVASVVAVVADILRDAPNRLRRLVTAGAAVVASVAGVSVVVVDVVATRELLPARRPVLGSRREDPEPKRDGELFPLLLLITTTKIGSVDILIVWDVGEKTLPFRSYSHRVGCRWSRGSGQDSDERIFGRRRLDAFGFPYWNRANDSRASIKHEMIYLLYMCLHIMQIEAI